MYFVEYILGCCKTKVFWNVTTHHRVGSRLTSPKRLLLGLPDPEDEGNTNLQNCLPIDTALYPRTLESNTIQKERSMNRRKCVLGQCS